MIDEGNEIPKVELLDVRVEHELKPFLSRKKFGESKTRWYAVITLDLKDLNRNQKVAEWFYLFACSPEFLEKPIRKFEIDRDNTIVQSEFDLVAIRKEAKRRYDSIKPESWEDFYIQMNKKFSFEDADVS